MDSQHGEIVRRVFADDLCVDRLALFEADGDLDRVLDHVVVRQHRSVVVDHDARAGRLTLALLFATEQVERRFALLHDRRRDERDPRGIFDVDVVRRQPLALLGGVRRRNRRGLNGRDRLLIAAQAAGRCDDGHDDASPEEGRDERDEECALHAENDRRDR